ncbi:hypothetical protein MP228_009837 [Amoeboaphelidium protococcarum]|nr:hypothetical protein MP228_009837 [Amoeboaphelidium protococcarum]
MCDSGKSKSLLRINTHRVNWGLPRRPEELGQYRQSQVSSSRGLASRLSPDVSFMNVVPQIVDRPEAMPSDAVRSVEPAVAAMEVEDGNMDSPQDSQVQGSSNSDSDLHSMSHYTARRSTAMEVEARVEQLESQVLAPESLVAAAPVGEVPDSAGGQSSQVEEIEEDSDETEPVLAAAERQRRLAQNELDAGDVWRYDFAPYFVLVAGLKAGVIDAEICCNNLGVDYQSVEGAQSEVIRILTTHMSSSMFMVHAQGRSVAAVGSSVSTLAKDDSILQSAPPNLPKHELIAWQNRYFKQRVLVMIAKEGQILDERIYRQVLASSRLEYILSEIGYLIEGSDSSEEEGL